MTTITVETKITYKYLMSKSKDWLATEYLRLLDQLDEEQKKVINLESVLDAYDIDRNEVDTVNCKHDKEDLLYESIFESGTFICKCGAAVKIKKTPD